MKRRVLALSAGLLLLGLLPGSTLAANPASIDQVNVVGSNQDNDGGHLMAQTFTVGKTGMLSSVDLWFAGGGSVTVDIKALDGSGHPTGLSLATGTGTASSASNGGWTNFPFSVPLSVTSGQVYAIVFDFTGNPGGPWAYGSNIGTDTYTGGVALFFFSSAWTTMSSANLVPDLAFRDYVDPNTTPAPSITPAPTNTPPPTSTAAGSSSAPGGGIAWFVPMGLFASFFGLIVLISRRRQRRLS